MSDAQTALAQVRDALADRPSAGPWVATLRDLGTFQVATVDNFGVYSRHPDHGGNAAGFPEHDAAYIAKCNPENIAAILAHVEAQAAEISDLRSDLESYIAAANGYLADVEAQKAEIERLQVGIELIEAENADLLTRLDLESGTVGMIARECADLRRQIDECSQMLARQAATIRELTRPAEE